MPNFIQNDIILLKEVAMFFNNLTVFQNVLFLLACLGMILLVVYLICYYTGFVRSKKVITSDDIDDSTENYKETSKFLMNALTIKGSIFCLAISSSMAFLLSFYLTMWLAITIGVVVAVALVIFMAFLDREPIANQEETAVVSEKIPAKNEGSGKVVMLNDNVEIDAESVSGPIKNGKKVIIVENLGNKVLVRKYKKEYK